MSIARFGDGELRLAIGGSAISQVANAKLARELEAILRTYRGFIVGIPNFPATPNKHTWEKYRAAPFAQLYCQDSYGSAFITRPDNAPQIDAPEYWDQVRALWRGRAVTLVAGNDKSITPAMLEGSASIRMIAAPDRDAYAVIDQLEEQIGTPSGVVILCLGATATALAARLAMKGVHALDLGHIGMFMKHAGMYALRGADLISDGYRNLNQQLHADPKGFGGDGKKHAERVYGFARKLNARSICDYGCGEGTLKPALRKLGFQGFIGEYDPAMPGPLQNLPKPAHLLVCTDVLEHIEPEKLGAVMRHQFLVAEHAAFMTIATRPANKLLPDGRNAHLIQESPDWWMDKLRAAGWVMEDRFDKMKDGKCREVWVWLRK